MSGCSDRFSLLKRCRGSDPASLSTLNAQQRGDERVDVLAGVVEARATGAPCLQAEPAQDRLGAMVAGAHGDALPVERLADILGADAVEHERENAGLLARAFR